VTTRIERRTAEKQAAVEQVAAALDELADCNRPLDQWERVNLIEAIGMIYRGSYSMGAITANIALTSPEQRGMGPPLPAGGVYDTISLAQLSQALMLAKDEPLREFPHFGPILFS
jgi:hypothetical protein